MSERTDAIIELFKQQMREVGEACDDPTCDGCAQAESECLCGIDIAEVLDCMSVYHPGCRNCEQKR